MIGSRRRAGGRAGVLSAKCRAIFDPISQNRPACDGSAMRNAGTPWHGARLMMTLMMQRHVTDRRRRRRQRRQCQCVDADGGHRDRTEITQTTPRHIARPPKNWLAFRPGLGGVMQTRWFFCCFSKRTRLPLFAYNIIFQMTWRKRIRRVLPASSCHRR